jgi:ferritin-like protein
MGGRNYFPGLRRSVLSMVDAEAPTHPGRRHFFRAVALHGASIPVVHFALSSSFGAGVGGAAAAARLLASESRSAAVGPDFTSPYLELVRRLREAAEVEQALMLQYLYAACSLKPAYQAFIEARAPGAVDLAGVAIQKMQHLVTVNRLLVALGVGPTLLQEAFPYDLGVYPFECVLEPLSRTSLAKYLYAEAPAAVFAPTAPASDRYLARTVMQVLGRNTHTNYIGGLYESIIASLQDCTAAGLIEELDTRTWLDRLRAVKADGEDKHFTFFRSVFDAHPDGAVGRAERVRAASPKPTPLVGRGAIDRSALPALSRLGDLHYWSALLLLDLHFHEDGEKERYLELARMQLLGPVWSLALHLPKLGGGMPFHPLSLSYTPRADAAGNCRLAVEMLREAHIMAEKVGRALPADYPIELKATVLRELEAMTRVSPQYAGERRMSGS